MKRRIVAFCLICLIICTGCSQKSFDSFAEVYEKGTKKQQLEFAYRSSLFEAIGFISRTNKGEDLIWEITNNDHGVTISYYALKGSVVGEIATQAADNNLAIRVEEKNYRVFLRGYGFSYICPLSVEDLSLVDPKEYAHDYHKIFEEKGITLAQIGELIGLYQELTQEYMKGLYELQPVVRD